jgi:acyl-CoA dehydrogenase
MAEILTDAVVAAPAAMTAEHLALGVFVNFTVAERLGSLAQADPEDDQVLDEVAGKFRRVLGEAGLCRMAVPERNGGAQAPHGRNDAVDVRSLCVIRERLAYHNGLLDLVFAMQALGSAPLALAGTPEQRAAWLPKVARGEAVAAFALTEAGAGSDVSAIATTATRDGDSYVLEGEKRFISNAGLAHFYVVFARTSGEGHRGLSAFLVPADTAGLTVAERYRTIAPHPIGTLRFQGCRVPATALLGQEGGGFKLAMATLDTLRPTVGAAALGFGTRALDESVVHAKRRQQFGKPIAEQQAIQLKVADMALALESARLLVHRAAGLKDAGAPRISLEAAMAKLAATEAAALAVDEAVQIHGGLGVCHGQVVERLYREERALRIYEGTSEVQRLIIAGHILKSGR